MVDFLHLHHLGYFVRFGLPKEYKMKKLYPLLSVLFLIYFGCEDGQDTTPPKVTITSPQDGSNVYEIITITCMSSDNEGVRK